MSRKETALRYFNEQNDFYRSRTQEGIERNRKRDAEIRFESDGPLPEEIAVEVRQTGHEFRFGANLFMLDEFESAEKNAIYREKFPELFNLATLPFYWSDLEPEEGKPRYAADSPRIYRRPAPDFCVNYCREKGIEPKCHCLNYDIYTPDWLKHEPVPVIKEKMEKRFREIAERYASVIPSFEVTNETLVNSVWMEQTAFFDEPDYVEWSFRTAAKYFPNSRLIINDFDVWRQGFYNSRNLYYLQIERLLREGITHLDSVGFQFHSFGPREAEPELAAVRYNPDVLYRMMDAYVPLGRAEQITEMTLPCYSANEEDEEVQAELIERVYSVFFSHPAMEAVIYWNLVDGYAAFAEPGDMSNGENGYYGGLLRFDMSEKPAFRRLKKLIREDWHTQAAVKAKDGAVKFRGFCGTYEADVYADGKKIPIQFAVTKNGDNTLTVKI